MNVRRTIHSVGLALAGTLVLAIAVQAGSMSSGGVTLTWPEYPINGTGFVSCEPWQASEVNTIRLDGLPAGSNVTVQFIFGALYTGAPVYATPINISNPTSTLLVPVPYPQTAQWPVWDAATNTKAIAASVAVAITNGSTTIKVYSKKWWVKCGSVPPAPYEGCTLGFYKNNAENRGADQWPAGFAPGDSYDAAFGVSAHFMTAPTLLDALNAGGGQEKALARQGTAALLNAAGLNFKYSTAEVLAIVQAAYGTNTNAAYTAAANTLAFANEGSGQGENCPLDNGIGDN
jgi:hypothetical protein